MKEELEELGEDSINEELDSQIVPGEVVDEEAWEKYISLRNELLNSPVRYHNDIDLSIIGPSQIKNLPPEAKPQWSAYLAMRSKATILKKKALGIERVAVQKNTGLYQYANEIVELCGQYYSNNDICQILRKKYKFQTNETSVRGIRNKFSQEVAKLQEKHRTSFTSVRLSHKKSRLQELNDMFTERKLRYSMTMNRDDYKLLLSTLEQIRKEVDGDKLHIDINHEVNVSIAITAQIQKETLKNMSIIEIVAARVAAKRNVEPMALIARLRSSIYAKFTGMSPYPTDIDAEEIIYPSSFVYDIEAIKRKALEQEKMPPLNQGDKPVFEIYEKGAKAKGMIQPIEDNEIRSRLKKMLQDKLKTSEPE